MTLPTVDNVLSFPFLMDSVSGQSPLDVINGFINVDPAWISGNPDELWMAAGMKVQAFHCLDIDAVLTADFSNSDIVLGLFAHAVATVPPEAFQEEDMFARGDMGLLSIFDWTKGIFKVEGQVTPKSFVLGQDCELTDGFALAYFFEDSGHNSDWVFTAGGYHPAFAPRPGILRHRDSVFPGCSTRPSPFRGRHTLQ